MSSVAKEHLPHLQFTEVGIYKRITRKYENKKTRFRPRKRSRKKDAKERKHTLDQSDQEKK